MRGCASPAQTSGLRLLKAPPVSALTSSAVLNEWASLTRPTNTFTSPRTRFLGRCLMPWTKKSSLASGASSSVQDASENTGSPVSVVVTCAAGIMLSCAILRVNFSAMAPVIVDELGLSLVQLAYIHSSFLIGYCLGQLPAGLLADRIDGYIVLCTGALAWSVVTLLHAPLAIAPTTIAPMALASLRMLVGLTTAVAVPGLAATLAQSLPIEKRSKAMSTCYGLFNMGSALGLALTPLIAAVVIWPVGFAALGGIGTIMAIYAFVRLQEAVKPAAADGNKEFSQSLRGSLTKRGISVSSASARVYKLSPAPEASTVKTNNPIESFAQDSKFMQGPPEAQEGQRGLPWFELKNYAALIYNHSAIGWGFFLFQNWIPTYLQSLHVNDAMLRGLLSALPWMACFALALVFGGFFERLRRQGMSHFRSQTLAHTIASVGAAAALIPIACLENVAPVLGLFCIGGALSLQTCNYSGFHSYIQTTYPDRAGRLLGVTNSCGIAAGIVANLAMGWMVQLTGSYRGMFAATAVVYFLSWVVWVACLREKPEKVAASTL